jgi:hypothetical protein
MQTMQMKIYRPRTRRTERGCTGRKKEKERQARGHDRKINAGSRMSVIEWVGATHGSKSMRQRPHAGTCVAGQIGTRWTCKGYLKQRQLTRQKRQSTTNVEHTRDTWNNGRSTGRSDKALRTKRPWRLYTWQTCKWTVKEKKRLTA